MSGMAVVGLVDTESRALGIGQHREAADLGHLGRGVQHLGPELFGRSHRGIDVVGADVGQPVRGDARRASAGNFIMPAIGPLPVRKRYRRRRADSGWPASR